MPSVKLATLADVPVAIVAAIKGVIPFRPSSRFSFPVGLTNLGERSLEWTDRNALNLAYRWLSEHGEILERDGRRTFLPVDHVNPGQQLDLEVLGNTPDQTGTYRLQVSLVLEGIHWATDVGATGWAEFVVQIVPVPAWPDDLRQSRGGRALRGAMVAHELARLLEKRSFLINPVRTGADEDVDAATSSTSGAITKPRSRVRWRDRLRAVLGVSGLEHQLESVLAIAGRQERLVRELEGQLLLLREDLGIDLEMPEVGAPEFEKDMAEARMKLEIYLSMREQVAPSRSAASGKRLAGHFTKPKKHRASSRTPRQ